MTEDGRDITDEQRKIVNQNLIDAARSDDRVLFELCLQKGASLNARWTAWYNKTPLMLAVGYGNEEQTAWLLAKGPDLFLKDDKGKTVFDLVREVEDLQKRKKINTLLLAALPDAGAPARPAESAAAGPVAGPVAGQVDAGTVETGKDISILKPLEIDRRKKHGGSLQL